MEEVKNVHVPKSVVKKWLRVRDAIEFLGLWETIHNPNFKGVEFGSFRKEAGRNETNDRTQRTCQNATDVNRKTEQDRY